MSLENGQPSSTLTEDQTVAKAVSAAYMDKPRSGTASPAGPRAVPSSPLPKRSDQSPSRVTTTYTFPDPPDTASVRRAGSVRSKLSGGAKRRRHRGSSSTTGGGGAIAAAIGASTSTLINGPTNTPRMTGFAVASSKRNRDFHNTFRSVPEDDYLIEDYSAALQRDILLQGRFYVSEGHICFSSNILGWVTNLVMSFDEIVSVEKKSTAFIFPNALVIQTLHARHVFASFLSRDATYDLLISIWKISHPNLKSSLNGVQLDNSGTGDRTEKAPSVMSDDATLDGSEDEVYDEDEEEGGMLDPGEEADHSATGSEVVGDQDTNKLKPSASNAPTSPAEAGAAVDKALAVPDAVATGTSVAADFPGPVTHGPSECGDQDTHYDKVLMDTVIAAPLGKIYSLMFGPASNAFMRRWLVEDQKSTDLQMEDVEGGLGESRKTYQYSFIKPLTGAIGPKQTQCIINQTLQGFDLDKAVTVDCSTQNPDVPSGNVFVVRTRYCLMWAPGNSTRMVVTHTIEWSGRSFIKGPIERGANDGQTTYVKDLVAALRAAVSAKAKRPGPSGKAGPKSGRRRAKDAETLAAEAAASAAASAANAAVAKGAQSGGSGSWGILEPLHALVGPILDPVAALVGGWPMLLLLSFLTWFLIGWWRGPAAVTTTGLAVDATFPSNKLGMPPAQRVAMYEDVWQAEEAALWDWLEERTAQDGAPLSAASKGQTLKGKRSSGESDAIQELELRDAIRVTEAKLKRLKSSLKVTGEKADVK